MAEGEGSTIGLGPDATDATGDGARPTPAWLAGPGSTDLRPPPDVCRFLATAEPDGSLGPASEHVDEQHRCVALGDGAPQSARQQELVCLAAAHKSCPRYLRGMLLEGAPPAPPAREPISVAVVASALILVTAIAASFGFLAVRGGLAVALASPSASPGASQIALVPAASISPIASPTPASTSAASPPPTASPTAAPTPSPTPAITPSPTPRPTPRPSSDRYAVLSPCPSTPNCWIYTVRSGDNLVSIAHWFGVPLDTVYAMNPWLQKSGLRAGQELRLPPPTR